jgi:hypothetical protein
VFSFVILPGAHAATSKAFRRAADLPPGPNAHCPADPADAQLQACVAGTAGFIHARFVRVNLVKLAILHRGKIRHHHVGAALQRQFSPLTLFIVASAVVAGIFACGQRMRESATAL